GRAGAVRGGGTGLLLLDGRLVLRDHDGAEPEERVSASEPVPAIGRGILCAGNCAATGGGEDSQSENAAATEPRGAGPADAGGAEGDGGAGRAWGFVRGAVGDRRERGAAVFRGLRGDDQAGRERGGGGVHVRSEWAEPETTAGSGKRAAVAGVQRAGEGPDGGVLRGGRRPVRGVVS